MTRTGLRWLLALLYGVAGVFHLIRPAPFLSIMPGPVPFPDVVVWATGVAESLEAVALAQPWHRGLRRAGSIGLALYALCVAPANMNHCAIDMVRSDHGLGLAYHIPRLLAQPLIIWLALWTGGATNWPFGRPSG